jgi:glycosyltransferase involved in cell wall biosynthesis
VIRLLTGLPRPNGVGEYVSHLTGIGVPVEVFYRRPMTPSEFEATPGHRPRFFETLTDLRTVRRHSAPEIARTHVTWEGMGPIYGARTRLLTVHHVLGPRTPWESEGTGRIQRAVVFALARRGHHRTVRFGIRTVVPSASVRDDLLREYHADGARIEVVPHFIDTEFFRPVDRATARRTLDLPAEGPILLHVGVDDARKNIGGLLTLFHRFRRNHPTARLVQIGASARFAAGLAGSDGPYLRYVPGVPGPDRPVWYSGADVVVLPTFHEGFGRAALEAMSCGTPAVVTDLPVFREELGPRFRGAPVGAWDAWVRAVDAALAEPEPDRERGWVVGHFSHAAFASAYRRIYAETLSP